VTLTDGIVTAVVAVLAWLVVSTRLRALSRRESQVVAASFLAHLVSTALLIVIAELVYAGGADFNGFDKAGGLIADEMRLDFWEVGPRVVLLFLHQDAFINVPLNLEPKGGRSTVSMFAVAAVGNFLLFRSFPAIASACALFSLYGKVLIYETFRPYFPARHRAWVAGAVLLVPSVVFWTSGLIKEAIAIGGLGFAIRGLAWLGSRRTVAGAVSLGFGVVLVTCIKPYLLMPLAAGTAAWIYSTRARGPDGYVRIRPAWIGLSVALALVGFLVVGQMFPQFSVERLGEEAARMQFYGRRAAGGSTYLLGDPNETSLLGQLRFAPIALFTALFRPLVLEASSPQILVNALETTVILGATAWLLVRKGWRWMLATVTSNPALAFALAFALPLALGVGLISNNLGTLSRYRCPLVPFLVLTLVALVRARGTELLHPLGAALPFAAVRARAPGRTTAAAPPPGRRTVRRPAAPTA
jgi:hypothetical protein